MQQISSQELERIKRATAQAESLTGGEIVTVIDPRRQRLHAQHLLIVLVGVITFFALIWYVSLFNRLLLESWLYGAIMILLFVDIVMYVYRYLGQSEAAIARKHYAAIARSLFTRRKSQAGERPLLLFYVSLDGKHAEIVTDKETAGRISQSQWQEVINHFAALAAQGHITDAFVKALYSTAQLLQQHTPGKSFDPDHIHREMTAAIAR